MDFESHEPIPSRTFSIINIWVYPSIVFTSIESVTNSLFMVDSVVGPKILPPVLGLFLFLLDCDLRDVVQSQSFT